MQPSTPQHWAKLIQSLSAARIMVDAARHEWPGGMPEEHRDEQDSALYAIDRLLASAEEGRREAINPSPVKAGNGPGAHHKKGGKHE
jgi:hypothetical protein